MEYDYYSLNSPKPTWANKETYAQANPQPEQLTFNQASIPTGELVTKQGNYSSMLNQQGEQRTTGYYQSTTKVSDIIIGNKRVFCFTNTGQLLDETVSDKDGVYRFDHLLMNQKYMFVAQYNEAQNVKPDYLAAASDWQSPTAYK